MWGKKKKECDISSTIIHIKEQWLEDILTWLKAVILHGFLVQLLQNLSRNFHILKKQNLGISSDTTDLIINIYIIESLKQVPGLRQRIFFCNCYRLRKVLQLPLLKESDELLSLQLWKQTKIHEFNDIQVSWLVGFW